MRFLWCDAGTPQGTTGESSSRSRLYRFPLFSRFATTNPHRSRTAEFAAAGEIDLRCDPGSKATASAIWETSHFLRGFRETKVTSVIEVKRPRGVADGDFDRDRAVDSGLRCNPQGIRRDACEAAPGLGHRRA